MEELKDESGKTEADYQSARDSFSEDFRKYIGEAMLDGIDSYLLTYGDPKEYRAYVNYGGTLVDNIMCYLVTQGKVHLDESVKTSEEELAKLAEKREKAQEQAGSIQPQLTFDVPKAGYL